MLVGAFKLGKGPNEYPLRFLVPPEPANKPKQQTSPYVADKDERP